MKSQKGFSPVVIVLLIALVGIVGATGWYVYSNNKKTNESLSNTQKAANSTVDSSKKATATAKPTTTPTPTQSSQKYLVIKEWGVKIPVDDKYSDITYKNIGNDVITLQSATFAKLSNNVCSVDNNSDYVGRLLRYDANGKSAYFSDGPGSEASPAAIKVGNNTYDYAKPVQLYCSDTNSGSLREYMNSTSAYLQSVLKSIQTAQ